MVSRLRASVVCRQDGLDIDCVQNALIEENYFDVDDDALCVKSGRDWDGRHFGRPARDILFRNNVRDSDGINRGKTACESGKHSTAVGHRARSWDYYRQRDLWQRLQR